jgi:hypothetical protein
MTRLLLVVFCAALVAGCIQIGGGGGGAGTVPAGVAVHTVVLDYSEFGPDAAAREILGVAWWQWKPCGGSCVGEDYRPVNVVVYRDVSLDAVQAAYPVIPEKNQDYRYLEYKQALDYLNSLIAEYSDLLAPTLEPTRKKILEKLGK